MNLIEEEWDWEEQEGTEEVYFATQGKGKGKGDLIDKDGRPVNTFQASVKCWYCGAKGHFKDVCYTRWADEQAAKTKERKAASKDTPKPAPKSAKPKPKPKPSGAPAPTSTPSPYPTGPPPMPTPPVRPIPPLPPLPSSEEDPEGRARKRHRVALIEHLQAVHDQFRALRDSP